MTPAQKIKMCEYFCLFCMRTYSGYVYARDAVNALLVGLQYHMFTLCYARCTQCLLDCASMVHVCTRVTADMTSVSWVNKSLAQFTGTDNPRNCSHSVECENLTAQKFPLLRYSSCLGHVLERFPYRSFRFEYLTGQLFYKNETASEGEPFIIPPIPPHTRSV